MREYHCIVLPHFLYFLHYFLPLVFSPILSIFSTGSLTSHYIYTRIRQKFITFALSKVLDLRRVIFNIYYTK